MPNLDLKINGDCISAVTALANTERAVGSLQSRAGSGVGVAVSVSGARAAAKDLGAVSSAIQGTSAAAAGFRGGGPIAAGLGAGAVAARGLTSSLSGTSRALNAAQAGVGVLAGRISDLGRAGARVPVMPLPGGGAGGIAAATRAVNAHRSALAAQQLQMARGLPVLAMANAGTAALAGNTAAATTAATRLQARDPLNGRFITQNPGILGTIRQGWREGVAQARAERANPPPVIPPGGRGGGGGGGAGDDDAARRGAAAGKAVGELGKEIGSLLMAGLAIGVAADAAITKAGTDAVNKTISETPILAQAAKDAADEFGKGILDVSQSIADDAAPSFERLATAQRAYGQVTGQIGMQNLNTFLEGQAKTTDAQTRALINYAPAINSAIRASDNLGIALLEGVSNPSVVNGAKSLSDTLARPEVAQGLRELTTGLTTSGLIYAKFVSDVGAGGSKLANILSGGSQNALDMSPTLTGAAQFGALGFMRGGMKGGLAGALLGGSAILGSQQLQAEGRDDLVTPSLINGALGALIGSRFGLPGMVAGGLAGQYGTAALGKIPGPIGQMAPSALSGLMLGGGAGFMMGGPVGGAIGAGVGAVGGGLLASVAPGGALAPAPENAPGVAAGFRQSADAFGQAGTPLGALQQYVTGAIGEAISPTPGPGAVQPGPQTPEAPKSQIEGLQQRAQATRDRVNQERRERGLRPAGSGSAPAPGVAPRPSPAAAATPPPPPPPPPPTSPAVGMAPASYNAANATQQLSQNAQQATQSVQQLGQAMPQTAQQATAMPRQINATNKTIASSMAAQERNMNQSASQISQSATQIGSEIPQAISAGIVKQTPKVCEPAANMGASVVNCTASALRSASPSKKFIALGESTGDGMKIGVDNSAPGAVESTGSMVSGMLGQVGALGSGVQAASDGVVPIAEAGGLMVGYVWARSVATGVDSVIKTADFASMSMPAIDSALAKTALGKLGLLGPAGSGAAISKSANGGMISFPSQPPIINATVQVVVDGAGPMQVISQRVVDTNLNALADSIGRQRG